MMKQADGNPAAALEYASPDQHKDVFTRIADTVALLIAVFLLLCALGFLVLSLKLWVAWL